MPTREEEQAFERQSLAMIGSMTLEERIHPDLIDRHRMERIAHGSGTSSKDVKEFVRAFLFMRDGTNGHGSSGPSCSGRT
jgi:signal recognition particle subunit SRP54